MIGVSERFQGANSVYAGRLSPYWGEHAARYGFALPFVEKKSVLDIACGTGYGLGLLKARARHVVGVDVNFSAMEAAKSECSATASVLLGDGLMLPFCDESFDVVTSFETLEHLHERGKFLGELKRVLKHGGTLILSTPSALYTQPINGKPSNPFHVFEYSPDHLRKELELRFTIEKFLGQELEKDFGIPPFHEAQKRLANDFRTQSRLLFWKITNKMPIKIRDGISEAIWGRPFYPTENDYVFGADNISSAPVLVVVCSKSK